MGSRATIFAAVAIVFSTSPAFSSVGAEPEGELLSREGTVQFTRVQTNWLPAEVGLKLNVTDRLRTLALSRATVSLAQLGRLRVNELTTLEILPPKSAT